MNKAKKYILGENFSKFCVWYAIIQIICKAM